jgi:hypothetical protein
MEKTTYRREREDVINDIMNYAKKERGSVKLTKTIIFYDKKYNIININSNGGLIYENNYNEIKNGNLKNMVYDFLKLILEELIAENYL